MKQPLAALFMPLQKGLGLGLMAVLCYGALSPLPFLGQLWLTDYLPVLMFGGFALGFLAFLVDRPIWMLNSFLACISLSTFVRDQHREDAFPKPALAVDAPHSTLRVAHFSFKAGAFPSNFEGYLQEAQPELLSLQYNLAGNPSPEDLVQSLESYYPYQRYWSVGDSLMFHLASTYLLSELDTFSSQGHASGFLQLWFDSLERPLQLSSTHIAEGPVARASIIPHLNLLAERVDSLQPFLAFSGLPLKPWNWEIQTFCSAQTLKDSRCDVDYYNADEHIFFSGSIECLSFSSISEGQGVTGEYRFRPLPESLFSKRFQTWLPVKLESDLNWLD